MEDEITYMKDHPPRCLGGHCIPSPNDLHEAVNAELGDHSTVFTPVCKCSCEIVEVMSSEDYSPIIIKCTKCGSARPVFDPIKHGYDGELGHNEGFDPTTPKDCSCLECGNHSFRLALGFQYSGETDILEEEDSPDVKPEDLFGWLLALAKCEECGKIREITESECA